MDKKALIAMSGGVDSSVAAYLIKKDGYDCMGATMKLYDNEDACISNEKTCCSLSDIEDARSVCLKIGIRFYVFNFKEDFNKKVIDKFVSSYETGSTPNPCIDCNRYLKFDKFMMRAEELGIDYVVTGHYAKIKEENGRFYLKKAEDNHKDQSYVLYSLTQNQLKHTLFPLGDMTKEHIREIAQEQGFINAKKHDSQDICFVPDGDYASVIKFHSKKDYPSGDFVDLGGNVLGRHSGIINYTIGQRKGLGKAFGERLYVCSKNLDTNEVVLGKNEDLFSNSLDASDVNWIAYDNPPEKIKLKAKIRYNQSEDDVMVFVTGKDTIHIEFDRPQRAIAKGQAVVLYDGDYVVGGGTIL